MPFCKSCWSFLCSTRYDGDIPLSNHHQSRQAVENALQERCWICVSFWRALTVDVRDALQKSRHIDSCQLTTIALNSDGVQISISCRCPEAHVERFPGRLLRFSDILALKPRESTTSTNTFNQSPSRSRKVESITGGEKTLDLARWWLQTCQIQHSKCNLKQTETWYPTRLLNLREKRDTGLIRLFIPQKETIDAPYATLSHCWGTKSFFRLVESNYEELCKGVSAELLTKTFQEAISVCLALGVYFLWIDSLCIIQDGDGMPDWLRESQQMDKIYSHGLFNICATASEDGTQGLFRARETDILVSEFVELPDPEGQSLSRYELFDSRYWRRNIEEAVLLSRAWVFQERLISPRALHFTAEEIAWECSELRACESFPESLSRGMGANMNNIDLELDPADYEGLSRMGTPLKTIQEIHLSLLYGQWWDLVEQYSEARLTHLNDKPVAISAIAKVFQPYMQDTYSGGIWQKRVLNELLWQPLDVETHLPHGNYPPSPPRKYTPPSFSWLSVAGPVTNMYTVGSSQQVQALVTVVRLSLNLVSADPTGFVDGGTLHLQGKLLHIRLEGRPESPVWDLHFDPPRPPKPLNPYEVDYAGFQARPDELHLLSSTYQDQVFCLPLATSAYHQDGQTCWCLILEHRGAEVIADPGVFRRIGHARLFMDRMPLSQVGEEDFPCLKYDTQSGQHEICIV